jgi:multidrug efflux pump
MYMHGIAFFLRHVVIGLVLCGLMLGGAWVLFQRVPAGLVPEEDQGFIIMAYMLPPAASVSRTTAITDIVSKRIMQQPETDSLVTFAGFDILSGGPKTSGGVSFIMLKDWSQRTKEGEDSRSVAMKFMGLGMDLKDGMAFAFNPPPIMGMSLTGGFEGYVQNRKGASFAELSDVTMKLTDAANKSAELQNVRTTFNNGTPQYFIDLDRDKALSLGVPIDQIYATMQATFGSLYVNDFNLYGRNFRVSLQSDEAFRKSPDDLRHVYVRSGSGNLIPLDTLISIRTVTGPDLVERFNSFPSAKVTGDPKAGFSSGQALEAMERLAKDNLPDGFTLEWTGSSYQEKAAAGSGTLGFAFGIIMIVLILAAQYERWTLPFAVLTAVPFAVCGGILAIWLRGLNNDLYFQIGLITLIGLSAKNAILIVEFAMMRLRQGGVTIADAALEAARLRFRPIIMTSLAFMMGCIPLAISSGAGAGSRHAVGTGVIGGMLAATFVATLFIPMFFKLVAGISERGRKKSPVHQGEHENPDDLI